ncbi:TIGR00730 family Rossman fold protein [Paenibacillus albidus]|uniref:LOG family protein n=1 Tax=Paenibacillus albidus TaxID=2041023 RepID=UPI001BE6744A|nr:TIGR00730 family Rossman fold protein [Paenibacillus albidus]MBT2291665.1 TIGR00730 family Rossman fold protein [Paenibacillus albidus]
MVSSICVFAGSNPGLHAEYAVKARELGQQIAAHGCRLVYGGSRNGLMGQVADGVLASGSEAVGVMPVDLFKEEIRHSGLTSLIEVTGMHERKAVMSGMADAFIALPGGVGTFEELFEILCWAQIGIHRKPIGLLNVRGYFNLLAEMITHSVGEGFAAPSTLDLLKIASEPAELLEWMKSYSASDDTLGQTSFSPLG